MKRTTSHTPSGLPVLGGGAHADPADGACFMEYASLLAGERWSDHPRCTHPALAQLARLVNDNIRDDLRYLLVPLVPDAIGLTGRLGTVTPSLVLLCIDRLELANPDRRGLRRQRRRAEHRWSRAAFGGLPAAACRLTEPAYRARAGFHVMLATVRLLADSAPDELPALLADAIAVTRGQVEAVHPVPHHSAVGA